MDADDDEPVLAVARVPRLEVRERAQAVDAGVRPEVDQDDLAAERRERERSVAGGVQPVGDVGEVGRAAVVGELSRRRRRDELRAAAAVQVPLHVVGALEPALDRVRIAAERGLGLRVEVEDDRDARERHDDAERRPDERATQPRRDAAAAERDEQHRDGGAERVGDDQEHGLRVQVLAPGADGDVAEDRPCTGHEHEPEAQAEHEAAARSARAPVRSARRSATGWFDSGSARWSRGR